MDWSAIEAGWPEYKAEAKRQWGKLTEQQLTGTRGNREYLAARVREAYALTREEAESQLVAWQDKQQARQTPAR